MSVIVAALVWQLRPELMISSEKFLLVCLADQSNNDGMTVFLNGGTMELADRCAISKSTCRRLLDRLEAQGWIKVAVEKVQHRPRQYQLNLAKLHENQPNGDKSRGVNLNPLENPEGSSTIIQRGHPEIQRGHPEHPEGSNGACHIRNNSVLHEEYMGRGRRDGLRPPPLFSASPGTENGTDLAYRKLSEICRIQLPPSGREFNSLQAALVVLRDKMLADLGDASADPITDREAAGVITKLARYWKSEDWRGKKGDAPSPMQLVESYGAAKVWARN